MLAGKCILGKILIFFFFFFYNSKKSIVTYLNLQAIVIVYNANVTNTFSNWLQFILSCDSNILDCIIATFHDKMLMVSIYRGLSPMESMNSRMNSIGAYETIIEVN